MHIFFAWDLGAPGLCSPHCYATDCKSSLTNYNELVGEASELKSDAYAVNRQRHGEPHRPAAYGGSGGGNAAGGLDRPRSGGKLSTVDGFAWRRRRRQHGARWHWPRAGRRHRDDDDDENDQETTTLTVTAALNVDESHCRRLSIGIVPDTGARVLRLAVH